MKQYVSSLIGLYPLQPPPQGGSADSEFFRGLPFCVTAPRNHDLEVALPGGNGSVISLSENPFRLEKFLEEVVQDHLKLASGGFFDHQDKPLGEVFQLSDIAWP